MQVDATKLDKNVLEAFRLACDAQKNAYAPYSKFYVGAALKLKGKDKIYSGCNVENASYGATICAERNAIFATVAKEGRPEYEFLVVVSNTDPAIGPCALCLQVVAEFSEPDLPIYLANPEGIQTMVHFKDLLGSPFSKIPDTPDKFK